MILPLIDIDECAVNNGGCENTCENVGGSFKCGCSEGFELNADQKTCQGLSHVIQIISFVQQKRM